MWIYKKYNGTFGNNLAQKGVYIIILIQNKQVGPEIYLRFKFVPGILCHLTKFELRPLGLD